MYYGGGNIKIDRELLKGCIGFMVLSLFADNDLYGYQIIKNLERMSDKAFIFKDGTLYPILHGLEKSGFINSYWRESNSGRKRKYYSITDDGKEFLSAKLTEWGYFTNAVNMVLKGGIDIGED